MKSKFLRLNKACSEQWENMKPNEKGSFCDTCAKNVIDFTQLSQLEITEKIKNSKGEICARITKKQLETPLVDVEIAKEYKLPYSNIAASILLASTLTIGQTAYANTVNVQTEIVETSDATVKSERKQKTSTPNTTSTRNFVTFKGKVTTKKDGNAIDHAKITLVTMNEMLTTFSLEDGSFSLRIPMELLDDDNVIRVTYETIKNEEVFSGLEASDYVLSKKEIQTFYAIKAEPLIHYLGGIGHYAKKSPIVIHKGKKIDYKEFVKARMGKVSSCSLENKDYYHFESKAAIAIYGKAAKDGLYILIDKSKK
ncbi:hypothetical protein [Kordia sp.]|uniref:hypothetical protein n=1 Tax=Kordia sp. TaxID=1965332 RepID=UPI003B5B4727